MNSSVSFKPTFVDFDFLIDMLALLQFSIAIVDLSTKFFNLYAVRFLPLWRETKQKVKVNKTKRKSRFFTTFTFGFVCDYTFLRTRRHAFLNEIKSKSMLNATIVVRW